VGRRSRSNDDLLADQFLKDDVKESVYGKRIAAIVCAGVVFVLFRALVVQMSNLTNSGMEPNYSNGTYVYVTKFAYGYGKVSIPFSPLDFKGRFLGSEPPRGDVIIFRNPRTDSDFIARVMGLPGDRIQMRQGAVHINDRPVPMAVSPANASKRPDLKGVLKTETLPNGVSFDVLDTVPDGFYDNTNVYVVPPGSIFVMGDNRDNSSDSRVLSAVGYIPVGNIVGRVETGRNDLGK
jgi:signal peptidase I